MPPSSAAARSLALAVIGVGAASLAAHGQNVTAFNPYSGAALAGGPGPQQGPQAGTPARESAGPTSTIGPAFNPWSSRNQTSVAYDPGRSLPPPPPGPIKSRIVAVPELTTSRSKLREARKASATYIASTVEPVSKPTTPPAAKPVAMPAPVPVPPVAATPSTEAPAASQRQMAALAPPPGPPAVPPARSRVAVTLAFTDRSTELSDASRAELDRLAKDITDRTLRQVELRTIADNGEPDSRKISLARALIVRNYLIDKGVRSRIEIASIVGDGGERIEILVPGP